MANRNERRAETIANRGDGIDLEKFQRAVREPRAGEPPDLAAVERTMNSDLWALRRSLVKQLEPLLPRGDERTRIDAIFAEYRRRRDDLFERRSLELRQTMTAVDQQRGPAAAARRRALEVLTQPGLPFMPTSIALRPVAIWAGDPGAILVDSFYAPAEGSSWVKVRLRWEQDTGLKQPHVAFNYLWSNQSDYFAVVNAKCSMAFRGVCQVLANSGWLGGGSSHVSGDARLQPMEWDGGPSNWPPYQLESQQNVVPYVSADGGWEGWGAGDIQSVSVPGVTHELRHDLFVIPPGVTAMFEVRVTFYLGVDDGWADIDFASELGFGITSHLQLELLTAPSAINAA
jgi:hypothetical protein